MRALNELLTGNEILTTSGMTGDTLRGIDAVNPIIHAGEFRAIGTALATAMGVKLGRPDARVICVTGDGSFMMEQQELATARYHNIPVLVLILRNNAYGGMKRDQMKTLRRPHHRHRAFHPRPGQARRALRRQRLQRDEERRAEAGFQASAGVG